MGATKTKAVPVFDAAGSLTIPKGFLGNKTALKDPLDLREWATLIFLIAENKPERLPDFLGNRSTIWRIKKQLKAKGYLT